MRAPRVLLLCGAALACGALAALVREARPPAPEPAAAVALDAAGGQQHAAEEGRGASGSAEEGDAGADTPAPPVAEDGEGGGELPSLDDWPRYPEGDPRGGEPIMPVLEAGVDEPAVVEAAQWAVEHLRNLSDSGVYTSLRLRAITHAATQEGVYHNNTLLTVTLASPHLLDGAPTSEHRIIVMADLEDGVRSFAIDQFPVMEPDAIEEFWMRKVDAHRAQRDVELEALDREFDEHYDDICSEETARAQLRAELGPGPDGRAQSAHDAPLPVAREDDDDAPPQLDLGVERISLARAGSG